MPLPTHLSARLPTPLAERQVARLRSTADAKAAKSKSTSAPTSTRRPSPAARPQARKVSSTMSIKSYTGSALVDVNGDWSYSGPESLPTGSVYLACRAQLAELGSETANPTLESRQAFLCQGDAQTVVSQASFGGQFLPNNETGAVNFPCPWTTDAAGVPIVRGGMGSELAGFTVQIYLAVAVPVL